MERVLVVDDNQDIARMLAESWLPALGYAASAAHSAAAGHAALQRDSASLVLLDMLLPDSHDLEHLAAMQHDAPATPVIMMTAHGSERSVIEAFRMGARDFLIKPFTIDQLRQAVERVLNERRAEREQTELASALQAQVQQLTVLNQIGRSITSLSSLDVLLPRIVDAAMEITGADEGFLLLREEGSDHLSVRAARTASDDRARLLRLPIDAGAARRVIDTQRPLRIERTRAEDPLKIRTGYLVRSILLVPLLAHTDVLGVLGIDNISAERSFNDVHEHLLAALSDYAVIALQNARLFEQRLRAEARYRELFTNASDLLVVLNEHLTIKEINNAAQRLLGYPAAELVEQPLQRLVAPEAWLPIGFQLKRCLDDPQIEPQFEVDLRKANGDLVRVEVSARLLRDKHQHRIFCSARNMTERVQLQAQRTHAAKLAALEQAIAGVAHELNNPLTSIAGYSQLLLRDSTLGNDAQQDISRIVDQAQRAGKIVQSLLAFGRGTAMVRTALNMSTLVERSLALHTAHDWPSNITIECALSPYLPNVLADPFQLQQVIDNLINNALHAMHHGGGTLRLRTYTTDTIEAIHHHAPTTPLPTRWTGLAVVTEVADTGVGIAAHQLTNIFDPFWTTKAAGDGPGLGLSLCYGIIARHGGHIWASSAVSEGTTIFIALPPRPRENVNT
jgi:two-component system, NtrC family, sensor kinase